MEMIHDLIGTDAETILWWQAIIRAIIVFFIALLLIRLGGKRIFGKHTAFDIVLGIVLGTILGKAISGTAPFVSSLLAAITLVSLHLMVATASFRSDFIGGLVKGHFQVLVRDGEIQWKNMKRNSISKMDLQESIRMQGDGARIEDVESAYFERSGEISVQVKEK